ncbi:hypothetical protein BN1110_05918 [bacterium YEK0313]|nr:hypothetical protein BN1110_05918 [bacterium YEK0313]
MTATNGDRLVLSAVNAPYRRHIDAPTLAQCLRSGDVGTWMVHVATFFVDVRPELVVRFAGRHGIDLETLARTYRSVRDETGERSPRLEAELVKLDVAAARDFRGFAKAG